MEGDLRATKVKLTGSDADIEINGVSLGETLKKIQERLEILVINPDLEAKWSQLAKLGEQYRALEQELINIEKTVEILEQD